jgi:hypothetical protein
MPGRDGQPSLADLAGNPETMMTKFNGLWASAWFWSATPQPEATLYGDTAPFRPLHARFEMKRSITKMHIRWTALARIGQRNFSHECAGRNKATIIILPGHICFAMRKRLHGAKTTAGLAMAIRLMRFRGWR